MPKHRNPRQRLAKRASPDNITLDDLFAIQRDNLGKADAFLTSAEHQMEEAPSGDPEEDKRRRSHIEHLLEAAKFAVRAAIYTSDEIEAAIARGRAA